MSQRLLICPLKSELRPVLAELEKADFQVKTNQTGRMAFFTVKEKGWILAYCGVSKSQMALQAQHLIDHFRNLSSLICFGSAGALSSELSIGDVVLAQKTVEPDITFKFPHKQPPPEFQGASDLLQKFRNYKSVGFKTVEGIIASEDLDITTRQAQRLVASTGAVATAWEGAGAARASRFSNLPFLEIRSISDSANSNTPSDYLKHHAFAMTNLARCLIDQL